RHVVDYITPELQDEIKFTVEYEDGDWSGLRAILLEQYDLLNQPHYYQYLYELTEEKWLLENIPKKMNRFTYLRRRAHGQDYDDERKT
ncbi:hypothetical protein EV182_001578, partial [Spiromyces aspiralis]